MDKAYSQPSRIHIPLARLSQSDRTLKFPEIFHALVLLFLQSLEQPSRFAIQHHIAATVYLQKVSTMTASEATESSVPVREQELAGKLDTLFMEPSEKALPPHLSHDPDHNQKRTDPFQFGSRILKKEDNVFEFNAWDHVETDDTYKEYSEQQYAKQREAPVSDFDKSTLPSITSTSRKKVSCHCFYDDPNLSIVHLRLLAHERNKFSNVFRSYLIKQTRRLYSSTDFLERVADNRFRQVQLRPSQVVEPVLQKQHLKLFQRPQVAATRVSYPF